MSNYTKTTDFEAKDSLPSGDSGKIIRGSEFETEFDNIATAIATKADAANPTFTGTVTIDGLTVNGNTTLGNAATDTVTVTADIASNLIPSADDTYNLGASGAEWNDLFIDGTANIDSLVADTADINGGTIDGVTIGGSSAGAITGTAISGTSFASTGNMTFGDNNSVIFGAGSDLSIFHDGTHSYIRDSGTGNLNIQAQNFTVSNGHPDYEYYINAQSDGYLKLYYNGSEKLATTTTGVDVTGTVTADGLTVDGSGTVNGSLSLSDTNISIDLMESDAADVNTRLRQSGGDFFLQTLNDAKSAATSRINVDHNTGDISFYEDTGTTAKFFWDASAELLTLGTGLGGTANHPLNVGGEIAVINNSGANPSDAGSFYWKESGSTWGTDMFGARARYDGSANILKFEFANLTSTGTNLELERDTGNVHIPTGKLGIGTTSPDAVLTVSTSSSSDVLKLTSSASTTPLKLLFEKSATEQGIIEYNRNGDLELYNTDTDGGVLISGSASADPDLYVAHSGNVGIGTGSPDAKLVVSEGGTTAAHGDTDLLVRHSSAAGSTAQVQILAGNTASSNLYFSDTDAYSVGGFQYNHSSNYLATRVNNSEAMRIDASGNVLVGTTDTSPATNNVEGISLRNEGHINLSRAGGVVGYFNRRSSDGTIADFRRDGAQVGIIGSNNDSGSKLFIGSSASAVKFKTNAVVPCTNTGANNNNDIDLGENGTAFKDLYLSGGAYIGGTAAANKLDDYEEGTFTPTLFGSTTAGTPTYANQAGNYTKIGNRVICSLRVGVSAISGAAGNVRIGGLPFASSGETSAVVMVEQADWPTGTTAPVAYNAGSTEIRIYYMSDDSGWTQATIADEYQNYIISISYQTTA